MEKFGVMAQRGTPLSEELLGTLQENCNFEDSDGEIDSFEETLNAIEELIRNEDEMQEVLDIISRQTPPSSPHTLHELDLNYNVVPKASSKTDLHYNSDDDIQIVEERLINSHSSIVSTKPENILSLSAPPTPFNQSVDTGSFSSPCSNPPQPSDSDLQNFGINVLSSFLPNETESTSFSLRDEESALGSLGNKSPLCTPSSNDFLKYSDKETSSDKQALGATTPLSDPCVNLDDFPLILDTSKDRFEKDFDENSNLLGASSLEVKSPSPLTEELLLGDSTDSLFEPINTLETCMQSVISDGFCEGKNDCKSMSPTDLDFDKSPGLLESPIVSLPSPPPPLELLDENKTLVPAVSVPSNDEFAVKQPLPGTLDSAAELKSVGDKTESLAKIEDEPNSNSIFKKILKSTTSDVFVFGQDSKDNVTSISPSADSGASTSTGSSNKQAVPAWAVPWVSTDAAENEDNNDPNWEILQKLSTDEERYRVVREKWHQLEIPDPRRDLTCNNFRRSQPQSSNNVHMLSSLDMQSRKRGRSPDKTQDDAQSHKRRRMMSCTDLFNNRIKDLRQKLDEENLALRDSYNEELNRLSIKQQEEQERYYRSSAPPHILKRQMMDLQYHQLKQVSDLESKFHNKLDEITYNASRTIDLLCNASKEVLAFNRFYTDLKYANDDHCKITEEEYNQFMQTEEMLDYYDQVY